MQNRPLYPNLNSNISPHPSAEEYKPEPEQEIVHQGNIFTAISGMIFRMFKAIFSSTPQKEEEPITVQDPPENVVDTFFKQISAQNKKHLAKLTNPEIEVTVVAKSTVGPSFEYKSTFTHTFFNIDTDNQIGLAHDYQQLGQELINECFYEEYHDA